MSDTSTGSFELGRARSSTAMIDRYSIIPIAGCAYGLIVFPLLIVACDIADRDCLMATRPENKIFWPAAAAISVVLAARYYSRLSRLAWPPHIICLLAYLAFAGVSILWAFKPEISFIRFAQQTMVVTSIVLPIMLAVRSTDVLRGLFLCFAIASILNAFFVFGRPPIDAKFATFGYPGYFPGKNYLGECAAVAVLLALHEMLYPGLRRVLGVVVALLGAWLLLLSNSKTSIGLALLVPFLAGLTLIVRRLTRLSPAIILLSIPFGYVVLSNLFGFNMNRLSYMLYGDSTFTGRTIIWDFVNYEIGRKPLLGWGYQSFWLVGPDGPSVADAPGWVKNMPSAHNGYLDTMLEVGYVGFALLISFIIATLHALGRMIDRDPARAWLILSLLLFVIITNGLESWWMRGFEMLWVLFVILAAEIGRYWQPLLPAGAVYRSRVPRQSGLSPREAR